MASSSTSSLPSVGSVVEKLSNKAEEWYTLEASKKVEFIEYALQALRSPETMKILKESAHCLNKEVRHMEIVDDEHKKERQEIFDFYQGLDLIMLASTKVLLDGYLEAYRVRAGQSKSMKKISKLDARTVTTNSELSKTSNEVRVAKIYPFLPGDKSGTMPNAVGEVYIPNDSNNTGGSSSNDIKLWNFEELQCSKPGLSVVLGAGNVITLTISDCMYQLFTRNQVVVVKHHPLHFQDLDPFLRCLFKPLFDRGYLIAEPHVSNNRTQELIYHKKVQEVHLTGGKAAHDAIVWGPTEEEQKRRKASSTPKLQSSCSMTSELGAATPYIVTPVQYTYKELDFQAQVIVSSKFFNGGACCNAPQVVVMSAEWPQRRTFIDRLEYHWKSSIDCPIVAYYPGTKQRVEGFKSYYEKKIKGGGNDSVHEYSLSEWNGQLPISCEAKSNGKKNEDWTNFYMPLLVIEISNIDISTVEGLKAAQEEYALQNEAFGPVLVLVTLAKNDTYASIDEDRNGTKQAVTSKSSLSFGEKEPFIVSPFMDQAVRFCNTCVFGTLSCSIMVPDWAQHRDYIEQTLANLQYGSVCLNGWSASGHYMKSGSWCGYRPVESLENIQSGLGQIHNVLFIKDIIKTVVRHPIMDQMGSPILTKPRTQLSRVFMALPSVILQPSISNFLNLVAAVMGVDVSSLWLPAVLGMVVAASVAFSYRQLS